MAVKNYRSFWDIELDSGGSGADVSDPMTPDTLSFTPPDVAREVVSIASGKYANERVLGRLNDMTCTITLASNFHQLGQIGEDYEFDVEETLVTNATDQPTAPTVTYSVVGRLQSRSPGTMSQDNTPRPITLVFIVLAYTEKHSNQSQNLYQIDLRTDPQTIKQNNVDMMARV